MGGVARRATAITQLRAQNEHILLLDSGDSLFEGEYSIESENPKQGATLVAAMNAMGYDALALGGSDLAAPLANVQARFEEAAFPFVSSNAEGKDTLPNVRPYVVRRVSGHTVAIVGATSETAGQRLEALGLDRPQEVIVAVGQAVKDAQRRADVIIVLSNLKRSQVEALAQTVPGIDAIIGANWVTQPAPVALPGAEGQVAFHASGSQGKYLGVLTLHLDAQGQVTGFDGRSLALTSDYVDDPEMVQLMREHASNP